VRTISISERNERFLRRRLRRWREVFTISLALLVASMLVVLTAQSAAMIMGQGRVSSEEALGLLIVAVNSTFIHLSAQTASQWAALCCQRLLKTLIFALSGLVSLCVLFVGGYLVLLISQMPATRYWPEMIIALTGPALHAMMHPHLERLRFVVPEVYLLSLWIIRCHRRANPTELSDSESISVGKSSLDQDSIGQSGSISSE
jgi:hypothetical protein